jgi:hypothetical protein
MSTDQQQTQNDQQAKDQDGREMTEKPEVTDEHRAKAKEMAKVYNEDPVTTTMPGTGGAVSGTAVTGWVDEKDKGHVEMSAQEGDVEFRKTEEYRKQKAERE